MVDGEDELDGLSISDAYNKYGIETPRRPDVPKAKQENSRRRHDDENKHPPQDGADVVNVEQAPEGDDEPAPPRRNGRQTDAERQLANALSDAVEEIQGGPRQETKVLLKFLYPKCGEVNGLISQVMHRGQAEHFREQINDLVNEVVEEEYKDLYDLLMAFSADLQEHVWWYEDGLHEEETEDSTGVIDDIIGLLNRLKNEFLVKEAAVAA